MNNCIKRSGVAYLMMVVPIPLHCFYPFLLNYDFRIAAAEGRVLNGPVLREYNIFACFPLISRKKDAKKIKSLSHRLA